MRLLIAKRFLSWERVLCSAPLCRAHSPMMLIHQPPEVNVFAFVLVSFLLIGLHNYGYSTWLHYCSPVIPVFCNLSISLRVRFSLVKPGESEVNLDCYPLGGIKRDNPSASNKPGTHWRWMPEFVCWSDLCCTIHCLQMRIYKVD